MIGVKLLGGAKKALGVNSFDIEADTLTVPKLLDLLRSKATDPRLLRRENLIIAINGADSAALGDSVIVKSGDEVTVVTVVHGGAQENASQYIIRKIDGAFVLVVCVSELPSTNTTELLHKLRSETSAMVQAVNSDSVYSIGHIFGVVTIALEAERQATSIATKLETEILVRLAATNQISQAIERAGLRPGCGACIIALSERKEVIREFVERISTQFKLDQCPIPSASKGRKILKSMGLKPGRAIAGKDIESFLIERAAITLK